MRIVRVRVWRWVGGVGVVLVLMLGVRLIWGWIVGREVAALKAEARGRGEVVQIGDLKYPSLSDEKNAWYWQSKAAGAVSSKFESPRESNLEYKPYPPYPPEWWKLAEASETGNKQAFIWAREARRHEGVRLRDRSSEPLISQVTRPIDHALANALADGALYSHFKGDDAEALERWLDAWHIAKSLRHDDFIIDQLVANGIEGMECATIEQMAPGLRVGRGGEVKQRMRLAIEQLLDDRLAREGIRRGMAGERLVLEEFVQSRMAGAWLIAPLGQRELVRAFGKLRGFIGAAGEENWPRAKAVMPQKGKVDLSFLPGRGRSEETVPRYSRWSGFPEFELGAFVEQNYRFLAERRVAAVDLAWQMYRAEHGGKWPQKLGELAPAYLKELPKDPYRDDGREIGYVVFKGALKLPSGGDRPMLYFDAGAVDPPMGDEPIYGGMIDRRVDQHLPIRQYRDLLRFEPVRSGAVTPGGESGDRDFVR